MEAAVSVQFVAARAIQGGRAVTRKLGHTPGPTSPAVEKRQMEGLILCAGSCWTDANYESDRFGIGLPLSDQQGLFVVIFELDRPSMVPASGSTPNFNLSRDAQMLSTWMSTTLAERDPCDPVVVPLDDGDGEMRARTLRLTKDHRHPPEFQFPTQGRYPSRAYFCQCGGS